MEILNKKEVKKMVGILFDNIPEALTSNMADEITVYLKIKGPYFLRDFFPIGKILKLQILEEDEIPYEKYVNLNENDANYKSIMDQLKSESFAVKNNFNIYKELLPLYLNMPISTQCEFIFKTSLKKIFDYVKTYVRALPYLEELMYFLEDFIKYIIYTEEEV